MTIKLFKSFSKNKIKNNELELEINRILDQLYLFYKPTFSINITNNIKKKLFNSVFKHRVSSIS